MMLTAHIPRCAVEMNAVGAVTLTPFTVVVTAGAGSPEETSPVADGACICWRLVRAVRRDLRLVVICSCVRPLTPSKSKRIHTSPAAYEAAKSIGNTAKQAFQARPCSARRDWCRHPTVNRPAAAAGVKAERPQTQSK